MRSYASFAAAERLDGLRIGVIREYMNKKLYARADEESIDIVERALADLRKLGATIVDPGPEGALFQSCVTRYAPQLYNAAFAAQRRNLFPVNDAGQPAGDHIATFVDMSLDPARVPEGLSLRTLAGALMPSGRLSASMKSKTCCVCAGCWMTTCCLSVPGTSLTAAMARHRRRSKHWSMSCGRTAWRRCAIRTASGALTMSPPHNCARCSRA